MDSNKKNFKNNQQSPYLDDYVSAGNENRQSGSFDFVVLLLKLLKYWYLFAIVILLALVLAFLKNKTWVPIYRTVSTVLIEENKNMGFGSEASSYYFMSQAAKNINNQMIMYSSYDFISKAVDQLNMNTEVYKKGRFKNAVLYKNTPINISSNYISDQAYILDFEIRGIDEKSYEITFLGNDHINEFKIRGKFGESLQHALFFVTVTKTNFYAKSDFNLNFRFLSKSQQISQYTSSLSLHLLMEGATVMEASIVGSNGEKDLDFLTILNREFFKENLTRKNLSAERAIAFIDEQLLIIKDSMVTSESKLNSYQMRTGMYTQDSYQYASSDLEALNKSSSELRLKNDYLKLISDYLVKNKDNELLVSPSAMSIVDPQFNMLVNKYNELASEMKTLGVSNPIYQKNKMLLEDVKKNLKEAIASMGTSAKLQSDHLAQQYNKTKGEIASLPQKERDMLTLERDFKLNDSYYTFLLHKRTENQIQKASNAADNLIIDEPRIVNLVNGTVRLNTYLIYLFLGILGILLFIICKEFLFKFTIQSKEELETMTNFPVIGTIEKYTKKEFPIVKNVPASRFAESFRSIRSRMEYLVKREKPITLLVTSTEPQDGKTFVAMNLASVYQLSGKKTIIVDFDLRRPAMSKSMGMPENLGLSNILIGKVTLKDAIVKHPDYDFDVLPSGPIPPNPSELIRSEEAKALVEVLKTKYDYIILDCSPVGLISDSHSLSSLVDVVVYVVRSEKTNKNFFKHTVSELQEDGIENIALIYNDVNFKKGHYGGRYYDGKGAYYTKYGSYYHND